MKALKILLWVQLFSAILAGFWSWGLMFKGATGVEFYSSAIKELQKVQRAYGDRAPRELNGLSQSNLLERLQEGALESAHVGGGCFVMAIGLAVISGVELWLLRRWRSGREPEHDRRA